MARENFPDFIADTFTAYITQNRKTENSSANVGETCKLTKSNLFFAQTMAFFARCYTLAPDLARPKNKFTVLKKCLNM